MMVVEGGLSSRMQVMETLHVFTDAYEGVLRAFEALDTYYETVEDSGNHEMEAIEEDFNEVEGIMKGYLSGPGVVNRTKSNQKPIEPNRTQSNSIDAIGSILFGRKTKWYIQN